jgi:hypothetical protein
MWNDLLLKALGPRGPVTQLAKRLKAKISFEDFGGRSLGVYMAETMERLKQQVRLYEEMFGRTGDGKGAAVVGTAAAAAADAGAGEVGSDGAGSSSSERRWPTARKLLLEAEWVIRWVPSLVLCSETIKTVVFLETWFTNITYISSFD